MTVDYYDTTTGRPHFNDNDAPDIKVDPDAVSAYAEDVGNRIVRADLAALNAYTYARQGLAGHALDTGQDSTSTTAPVGFPRSVIRDGWPSRFRTRGPTLRSVKSVRSDC